MKIYIFILILASIILTPFIVHADCSQSGTTVIFVNGMLTFSKIDAQSNVDKLKDAYLVYGKNDHVDMQLGYNESHILGIDDAVKASMQAYEGGFLDYDLTNILLAAHSDVKTQKILLVGHSQGTFYTNAAYNYLISHGVDKNSIAVYNVGTPADFVAGNGQYLTSSTDKVINSVVRDLTTIGFAKKPMSANIDLPLSESEKSNPLGGHSFSNVYLAEAPDKIISDIDSAINKLQANGDKQECFKEPAIGITYNVAGAGYGFADGVGANAQYFATSPYIPPQVANLVNSVFQGVYDFGTGVVNNVASVLNQGNLLGASLTSAPLVQNIVTTNTADSSTSIVADQPSVQAVETTSDQTATVFDGTGGWDKNPSTQSKQDLLDDIKEKIDVLTNQIHLLAAQQGVVLPDLPPIEETKITETNNTNIPLVTGGGTPNYPKVLISEVVKNPVNQRFIELYNPNPTAVDMTGWYLQRKDSNDTSWQSFVTSTKFQGKTIPAGGYLLISKSLADSDILLDITMSDDNSLTLKNPSGEVVDKLGFGNAKEYEGQAAPNLPANQSLARKWDSVKNTEQDTDNNYADFKTGDATPKANNDNKIVPPPVAPDVTAPVPAFTLDAIQLNLNFPINFLIIDPIIGTASPSGLASYVFQWQEQGQETWQQDAQVQVAGAPASGNYVRNFIGQDGKTYNFQVQATDVAGNVSAFILATAKVSLPPKVLISEIQTEPIAQRFVELYNPTSSDINLTGWYLQRKDANDTSWQSLVSSTNFKDKTIKAGGYFLISRELANSDITSAITLSNDNSLALKNPKGEISDKVGWGLAKDPETAAASNIESGKSANRKWDFDNSTEQDTDNNLKDFELNNSTPGVKNNVILSTDATITSEIYTVASPVDGISAITKVPFGTSQTDFIAALVKGNSHQTWDFSQVSSNIQPGDILVITAQDGITKITYKISTITAWAPGKIDSFTPEGLFVMHTGNFLPSQAGTCMYHLTLFRDTYPGQANEIRYEQGPCSNYYPTMNIDAPSSVGSSTEGEYDFYISYCGGSDCSDDPIGEYYRIYFDGTSWSPVTIDESKIRLSADTNMKSSNSYVVSTIGGASYVYGLFRDGSGSISNVRFATSKANFQAALSSSYGANLDYSSVSDPVVSGDILKVTSQNGLAKTEYTITADTVDWKEGQFNNYPDGSTFPLDISFFTNSGHYSCYSSLYRSAFPYVDNEINTHSFACGGDTTTWPTYFLAADWLTAVGDYTAWMYDLQTNLGKYYVMHFDGTTWSAISPIKAPPPPPDNPPVE